MKPNWKTAVFAAAVVLAAPVGATTVEECKLQIDALAGQTADAPFVNSRDETSELGKLAEAKLKLSAKPTPKYSDAQQKMGDYLTKLNQVVGAYKFNDPTGAYYLTLSTGATGVVQCITDISPK
jgi:hypothetical protein